MKKILISEAEKAKILGMHYNAMGKSLVNEQKEQPQAQVAGAEAQSMNTNAMETQKNTVKSLLLRSPFLMPEEQDFESLKKDVTEVINTLKSSGFDVLKVHKLPEEYFPLYERMYDVAKKWPELYDVPGPYPYSLKGFIHKSGKENNWKGRQKL